MAKFRKKPVVIDAVKLPDVDEDISPEVAEFLANIPGHESGRDGALIICTLEGDMTADVGDYVIKGVRGEYYPCKPDIFEATYEEV